MIKVAPKSGFKLTKVGEIPVDWDVKELRDVTKLVADMDHKMPKSVEHGIPLISVKDFQPDGRIDYQNAKQISKEDYERLSRKCRLEKGDLLYSRYGTIGEVRRIETDMPVIASYSIAMIKVDPNQMPSSFLYFLLQSFQISEQTLLHSLQSAQPDLGIQNLQRIYVPYPDLDEQRRIAEVLSSVNEASAHTQAVIDQIQVVKRGLMQQLLTKGLPGWHSDYKPVGNIEVPASWTVSSLEDCAVIQTGIAKGRKYAEGQEPIDVPYLRVANVQDGYFDLSEIKKIRVLPEEINRYLLKKGDVLLTEGGDADKLGRGHIWQGEIDGCVHQNHVFCVRPNPQILDPFFFNYLTSSPYGKTYFLNSSKQTTNLASINSTQLKQFPCLLPSLTEQTKIVSTLDAVEQRLNVERDKKRQLETTKKGLMQQLLTGKRRVPVDEVKPVGGG